MCDRECTPGCKRRQARRTSWGLASLGWLCSVQVAVPRRSTACCVGLFASHGPRFVVFQATPQPASGTRATAITTLTQRATLHNPSGSARMAACPLASTMARAMRYLQVVSHARPEIIPLIVESCRVLCREDDLPCYFTSLLTRRATRLRAATTARPITRSTTTRRPAEAIAITGLAFG